jgi:hypothetical protein
MRIDAVLLVAAVVLVLMAFAPVAPSGVSPRIGLRTRIARQLHLWDRYLYHDPRIWHPRD